MNPPSSDSAVHPTLGRRVSIALLASLFTVAGAMHFIAPERYEAIVPPGLPWPRGLVYASGVAEIVGGAGLLVPSVRRVAGWGLIALLVCVFPANVYMAVESKRFAGIGVPSWALWARLPLQALLIAWVWRASHPQSQDECRGNRSSTPSPIANP